MLANTDALGPLQGFLEVAERCGPIAAHGAWCRGTPWPCLSSSRNARHPQILAIPPAASVSPDLRHRRALFWTRALALGL
ncbi:unnamed protein product [Urochloa humidicola]